MDLSMAKFMSCTCVGRLSIFSENQWVWVLEDFLRHYTVHFFFKYIYLQQTQTGFQRIAKDNFTQVSKCQFLNISF
jgi:hypothetical protein